MLGKLESKALIFGTWLLVCPAVSGAEGPLSHSSKVGLVLSGGGARGAAHIGVLKVLEREAVPIDCIAGTSFGALVGGLYALGYNAGELEQIFEGNDWSAVFADRPDRRLSPLIERRDYRYQGQINFEGFSPELPGGLWSGQQLIETLTSLTTEQVLAADYDFDRLPIPFRAVATDLVTGKPYVFKNGRLTEALRASTAIPFLFTPVDKGEMLLVDGGMVNNLPTDVAREMGADIVIAVDVSSPLLKKEEIRSFVEVIDQSIGLLMKQNIDKNRKLADLVLCPDLEGFTNTDYTKIPEIVRSGAEEAEQYISNIKSLLAGIDRRSPPSGQSAPRVPIVESISFQGLREVSSSSLEGEIKVKAGDSLDTDVLKDDLRRLYATRLFLNVDSELRPTGGDRYALSYLLEEAPLQTLGASVRYDRDYRLVALAEYTARQVFNSPSTLTISSRFGGYEGFQGSFRYVAPRIPFFFIEPKLHHRRQERLDVRDGRTLDRYIDKRWGGQLMFGGSFLKRLELEMGFRTDRVRIGGGTEPNQQDRAQQLAGFTLRLNRDSLDSQEFPRSGMTLRFQIDKRSEALGSDLSYSKWKGDLQRYLPLTREATLHLRAAAGYSRGAMPFYDRFYVGGFNFAEGGPWHLLGYKRDELAARQMGLVGSGLRIQLFDHPLSFAKRGFVTAYYNLAATSNADIRPYKFQAFHGGGLDFSLDTVIGPMRIAGGWGESGRFNLYLVLGPSF